MATVVGTVVSISLSAKVKKNGGGTYPGWELVYRTPDGEVRTIAKHEQTLKFNAALKNSLSELAVGDEFTLVQEKNSQTGFLDVKSVSKGASEEVQQPVAKQGGNTTNAPTRQSNNYETKEERAAKQQYIIRQSSLSNAIEVLSIGAKTPPSPEQVFGLAQQYVDWVYQSSARDRANQAVADIEDDIPY